MLAEGFITIAEASKLFNKDMSSIRRKIRSKEWIESRTRKVDVLIKGEEAILVGNTWLVNKGRLEEIYGKNEL